MSLAATRPDHPVLGLAEVAAMASLFVVTLWVIGPNVETRPWAMALYWCAVAIWAGAVLWAAPVMHRDPAWMRGWGAGRAVDDPGRMRNAWPAYLGLTAIAAGALLTVTALRDPHFLDHVRWRAFGLKFAGYLVYGPIQALAFFGYIQTRLRRSLACWFTDGLRLRALVALSVAGLFAASHAPNWPLAWLTLAIGLAWSWLFWARPSVLLAGFSHALLGAIVFGVMQLYTRIGPFYEHPEGHIVRHAIPGLRALVGDVY